jgi:hypothetical protein
MQYLLWILTKIYDYFFRIYVDVVFNHMTADYPIAIGVGGSTADTYNKDYPAVPYRYEHFHPSCEMVFDDPYSVSNRDL